jgi:CRP-like cAMP-binding protein
MNPTELKQIFPDFENGLLEDIAANGVVKSLSGDEYLMKTGQHFRNIILILDGIVKVYREDDEGNEFLMYYLEVELKEKVCHLQREEDFVFAVVVVLACIEPLLHSLQSGCWNFVCFHVALFSLCSGSCQNSIELTMAALAFVILFGVFVNLLVCKFTSPHFDKNMSNLTLSS